MANTFEDQARERFNKSGAFLSKAQTLLQDDLIARTVLADAVSAIKNMLQGYLLVRISRDQGGMLTQQWQEVAASNRMPELIRACDDAGLNIRDLGRAIRQLNDERNYRTHDDPGSRIQVERARQAMDLARTIAQRVNAAIKTSAVPVPRPAPASTGKVGIGNNYAPASTPLPSPATGPTTSAAAARTPATATTAQAPTPQGGAPAQTAAQAAPANATPTTPAIPDEVEDEGQATQDDTTVIPVLGAGDAGRTGGRGFTRIARRVGTIAAVLVVGVAAGFGGAVAIHANGAPEWLGFTRAWLDSPAQTTALAEVPTNPPSSSATTTTTTQTAGALVASSPVCQAKAISFTLTNSSSVALPWVVEAAGVSGASAPALGFSFSPTGTPSAAALGTMPPGADITIYVTGPKSASPFHIEAFGPGGNVIQLVAPTCG